MGYITASVLVDGEPQAILNGERFGCRDVLIPRMWYQLKKLHDVGKELKAIGGLDSVKLEVSNPRVIKWDDLMGINAEFTPMASPFLMRFYIGRVRNGYQYAALENALRKASDEGVRLNGNMAEAWNLDAYDGRGLGLSQLLPTVRGWDYTALDLERIFPPRKFI